MNVYDFDKTIYAGDSTLDFYFYCLKKYPKTMLYLPAQFWAGLLYVLGRYSKVRFKERFYSFLNSLSDIDGDIDGFWALNEYKIKDWYKLQRKDGDVVISASPEFLLKPICSKLGISVLIASKVDKLNGRYEGDNCYGQNKVERLICEIETFEIDNFYSDSLSDAPLAGLAKKSYIVDRDSIIPWTDYRPTGLKKVKSVFASKEFLGFLIIGGINALNGVVFAYLFSLLIDANGAFVAGYAVSLSISYLLNSFFTFKETLSWPKYLKFCLSYIPNFLIQNVIVLIFYNFLGWHRLFAYILAAIIGVPVTFILIKFFAFKKEKSKSSINHFIKK